MDQHQNTNKIISGLKWYALLQVYANKSMKQDVETYEYTTLKKHLFHKNGGIVCFIIFIVDFFIYDCTYLLIKIYFLILQNLCEAFLLLF